MKFLFDCEDEVCLPVAFNLIDDIKKFSEKIDIKAVENISEKGSAEVLKKILENMMVKHPKETGELFSKLWVLEEGEKAPNVFKTMSTFFSSEVAIDFFTSVLPSILQISKSFSSLLK